MSCIIINEMRKEKKGEIRIIGGKWKGKKIHFDLSDDLRPTPDRAKETLFNWLGQDLSEMYCLCFTIKHILACNRSTIGLTSYKLVSHLEICL